MVDALQRHRSNLDLTVLAPSLAHVQIFASTTNSGYGAFERAWLIIGCDDFFGLLVGGVANWTMQPRGQLPMVPSCSRPSQ